MAWTQNRTSMITRALKICRAVGEDQNASSSQLSNGVDAINGAIEELNNDGFSRIQMSLETITATGKQVTMNTATIGDELTMDILVIYITDNSTDQPYLDLIDYKEYYEIEDKDTSTGEPCKAYIDFQDPFVINFYPILDTDTTVNILRVKRPASLDTASAIPGLAKRYWDALVYWTAGLLADIYVDDNIRISMIKRDAEKKMEKARGSEFKSQISNQTKGAY